MQFKSAMCCLFLFQFEPKNALVGPRVGLQRCLSHLLVNRPSEFPATPGSMCCEIEHADGLSAPLTAKQRPRQSGAFASRATIVPGIEAQMPVTPLNSPTVSAVCGCVGRWR